MALAPEGELSSVAESLEPRYSHRRGAVVVGAERLLCVGCGNETAHRRPSEYGELPLAIT